MIMPRKNKRQKIFIITVQRNLDGTSGGRNNDEAVEEVTDVAIIISNARKEIV
jgi:hypothetical protein